MFKSAVPYLHPAQGGGVYISHIYIIYINIYINIYIIYNIYMWYIHPSTPARPVHPSTPARGWRNVNWPSINWQDRMLVASWLTAFLLPITPNWRYHFAAPFCLYFHFPKAETDPFALVYVFLKCQNMCMVYHKQCNIQAFVQYVIFHDCWSKNSLWIIFHIFGRPETFLHCLYSCVWLKFNIIRK